VTYQVPGRRVAVCEVDAEVRADPLNLFIEKEHLIRISLGASPDLERLSVHRVPVRHVEAFIPERRDRARGRRGGGTPGVVSILGLSDVQREVGGKGRRSRTGNVGSRVPQRVMATAAPSSLDSAPRQNPVSTRGN
jgi:hypothetical protein